MSATGLLTLVTLSEDFGQFHGLANAIRPGMGVKAECSWLRDTVDMVWDGWQLVEVPGYDELPKY